MYNPPGNEEKSDKESHWIENLSKQIPGVRFRAYSSPGRQIGSSCGQFTKYYYLPEEADKKEFDLWEREHRVD